MKANHINLMLILVFLKLIYRSDFLFISSCQLIDMAIVRFPQRPGALKLFVNEVLGPHDDITRFEFIKKTQRERGPALVGIELQDVADYTALVDRMRKHRFDFKEVNNDPTLFEYLI